MMNVNILNNLIKGISEQIPLVNSYYTVSPYDSWNVQEVKYGSVSFVITKVNTRETTTTYDATIYYADRLVEDNSNRDSVHSDAATVIQTIVGALNNADEYLNVSYPVAITLFEQDFADKLAGGYAQMSISAEGMGECFNDEFSVPEIIATSAYFTKDEIVEYFPLRTQLSKVAFTGAVDDIDGVSKLATKAQHDNLVESVIRSTSELAQEINNRISNRFFDAWSENIANELDSKVNAGQFDNFVLNTNGKIATLQSQIDNKVENGPFNATVTGLRTDIDNKVEVQVYNQSVNDIKNIKSDIDTRPTKQVFDNLVESVADSTGKLASVLNAKLSSSYFSVWSENLLNELSKYATVEQYNHIYNKIKEIENLINNGGGGEPVSGDYVTREEYDEFQKALEDTFSALLEEISYALTNIHNQHIKDVQTLDEKIDALADETGVQIESLTNSVNETGVQIESLTNSVSSALTLLQQDFTNRINKKANSADVYTKTEIDDIINNIGGSGGGENVDLSDYYTKSEIDATVGNINTILNNILYVA